MNDATTLQGENSAKSITTVIYGLYAASFLLGFTGIIAIILNYIKKEDVKGTLMESHFRWQINTFWFSLLWFVLGSVMTFIVFPVAILVYFANAIWVLYRIVRGWVTLYNDKPMYV